MISEEKVADIIQNKGSVWCINKWSKPYHIQQVVFDGKREFNPHTFTIGWGAENIYETEEEASEYLKYGNVTRTEKLELPMWKDVEELINEKGFAKYNLVINEYFECFFEIFGKYKKIRILNSKNVKALFFEELTRENYDKARDLAIRLWKGEEQ